MTTEIEKTRDRLLKLRNRELPALEKADRYFEDEQSLKFLSPVLQEQLGDRVAPIVISIPRTSVDVFDERLDIRGFNLSLDDKPDAGLAREMIDWFEYNGGAFKSQQAQHEALALGRSYALVGPNPDDTSNPLLTVESPFDCAHELDPATREVRYGIKVWTEEDRTRWVNLYHPDGRITWRRKNSEWVEDSRDEPGFGLTSLQPLIPLPRMLGRYRTRRFDQRLGRPIFQPVLSTLDAINKSAYDMMVSSEFHGLPRRWATGLQESDFVDPVTEKPIDTFSLIAGRMWGTMAEKAKFGQFREADLANFHNTIKLLFQITATLLGLPADYLGFQGENPPSADALRASESRLVKRAERMQTVLGEPWARVQRLRALHAGESDRRELRLVQTDWRSAATPTKAQEADAIVKLVQARDAQGRSILPLEQARIDLGYSQSARDEMREMDKRAMQDPYLDRALRDLDEIDDDDAPAAGGR